MEEILITGLSLNYGLYKQKSAFVRAIYDGSLDLDSPSTVLKIDINEDFLSKAINTALIDARFSRTTVQQKCLFYYVAKKDMGCKAIKKIASSWNIACQAFFVEEPANSFFRVLVAAKKALLTNNYALAVIISCDEPYGVSAVVLEKQGRSQNFYAVLTIKNEFTCSADHVDFVGSPTDPSFKALGLVGNQVRYTLGFIPKSRELSGIIYFIRNVLSMKYRILPWTSCYQGQDHVGNCSIFPRPWFIKKNSRSRLSAIIFTADSQEQPLVFELKDLGVSTAKIPICAPLHTKIIIPVFACSNGELFHELQSLKKMVQTDELLLNIAKNAVKKYRTWMQIFKVEAYIIALVSGHDKKALLVEIDFFLNRFLSIEQNKTSIETINGSYFSCRSCSKVGKVVFVYPGFYCSYVNMGKTLWQNFPDVFSQLEAKSYSLSAVSCEQDIYPMLSRQLSAKELQEKNLELLEKNSVMSLSSFTYALLVTKILTTYFQVKPRYALGYSLGELKMLTALDVWNHPEMLLDYYDSFSSHYHPKALLKNMPWGTYFVKGDVTTLMESCKNIEKIYFPFINTYDELIMFGDPGACVDNIRKLGYTYFPITSNLVVHCQIIKDDYPQLKKMFTLPVKENSEIKFYSAANFNPMVLNEDLVAESLAQVVCNPVNFPRLIESCYDDGGRVFVEIGPKNSCSNYINKILKGKDGFLSIPMDIQGADNLTSITRGIAKLLSHGVYVDLSWFLNCKM